ncbi:unnamed protein product, partial [Sphagnum jensenii]
PGVKSHQWKFDHKCLVNGLPAELPGQMLAETRPPAVVAEHWVNSLDKLSFSKVVSARTQVVQGTMYHLTIEVQEGGNPRLYDAKVWVKPWENFKKLEEFKPA